MVKRVNDKFNTIDKIRLLFKIQKECNTEDDIVENIGIGDKQLEYVAIKLFVDRVTNNKYFNVTMENYRICKEEAKRLFN